MDLVEPIESPCSVLRRCPLAPQCCPVSVSPSPHFDMCPHGAWGALGAFHLPTPRPALQK
eukprot:scaffold7166_cov140-Isochrysis_galbana.AAC.2